MKEEKEFKLEIGMRLIYSGKIVEVKQYDATHVLLAFENGGQYFTTPKTTLSEKNIVK